MGIRPSTRRTPGRAGPPLALPAGPRCPTAWPGWEAGGRRPASWWAACRARRGRPRGHLCLCRVSAGRCPRLRLPGVGPASGSPPWSLPSGAAPPFPNRFALGRPRGPIRRHPTLAAGDRRWPGLVGLVRHQIRSGVVPGRRPAGRGRHSPDLPRRSHPSEGPGAQSSRGAPGAPTGHDDSASGSSGASVDSTRPVPGGRPGRAEAEEELQPRGAS